MNESNIMPVQNMIYEVRSLKVMLDSDLASLYGVPTQRLNEAVKRNIRRFPEDFMFQITDDEWNSLISQIAISKNFRTITRRGGRRFHIDKPKETKRIGF